MRVAAPLPSGSVTFLLTDIEGSTRLFRRLGDRYDALLDQHNRPPARRPGPTTAVSSSRPKATPCSSPSVRPRTPSRRPSTAQRTAPGGGVAGRRRHPRADGPAHGHRLPPGRRLHRPRAAPAARVVGAGNGGQVVASADDRRRRRRGRRDRDSPARRLPAAGLRRPGRAPRGHCERRRPRSGSPRCVRCRPRATTCPRPSDMFVGRVDEVEELAELVEAGPTGHARRARAGSARRGSRPSSRSTSRRSGATACGWSTWQRSRPGEPIGLAVADTLGVAPGDAPPLDEPSSTTSATRARSCCSTTASTSSRRPRAGSRPCWPAARRRGCWRRAASGSASPASTPSSSSPLPADRGVRRSLRRPGPASGTARCGSTRPTVGRPRDLPPARRRCRSPSSSPRPAANVLTPARDPRQPRRPARVAPAPRRRGRRAAAHAEGPDRLELRPARPDRAGGVPAALGVRRQLRPGDRGGRRCATATSSADDVAEMVWSLVGQVARQRRAPRGLDPLPAARDDPRSPPSGYATTPATPVRTRAALGERYLADFPFADRGNRTWRARLGLEQATLVQLVDPLIDDGEVEVGHALARLDLENHLGEQSTAEAIRVLCG